MTVLRPPGRALGASGPLRVEFELPGGQLVEAMVRVAHDATADRFCRSGLEFLRLPPEQATALDHFLGSRDPISRRR
jgi:hypothetical protein